MSAINILVCDVWADDEVAMRAIQRNRLMHPSAGPLLVLPAAMASAQRVGLFLDSDEGIMAAHQPLPRRDFDFANEAGVITREPGCLSTFAAAVSSNERPERIAASTAFLRDSGLAGLCFLVRGRAATLEELKRVHSESHVAAMMMCQQCDALQLLRISTAFNTVFMNHHSIDAALYAAGSTIEATQAVIKGELDSALCIVRPPGHHSECGCAMGFGIFNSVAAAAASALNEGLDKILVVDWDIHHGNGTQEIFANDRRVLYFSAHGLYTFPAFARDGQMEVQSSSYVGEEPNGKGFSCNCAWTDQGYGDNEYMSVWERLLMPIAREYQPQLVLVSAGFDSAAGDEEGYQVTPAGYAVLLSKLQELAGGRVVVVLEGGYNIPAISHGLHACAAALLGVVDVSADSRTAAVTPKAQATADIDAALAAQRPYWKCLQ